MTQVQEWGIARIDLSEGAKPTPPSRWVGSRAEAEDIAEQIAEEEGVGTVVYEIEECACGQQPVCSGNCSEFTSACPWRARHD